MFCYSLPAYMKCIVFAFCASLGLLCADALLLPPIPDPSLVVNAQDPAMLPLTSDRPYDFVDLSDNDPDSDVDDDDGVEVVIPSCPDIKFRPFPYNTSAVSDYINLLMPTVKVFQPAYGIYTYDPSGGSYGREHIYEVQMIALFIDLFKTEQYLAQLWVNPGVLFCPWVGQYIMSPMAQGAPSAIDELRRCLPYNGNPNQPWMPMLESVSNSIKANVIGGKQIRTQATFTSYGWDKKLSVLRSAAGVMSYMTNDKTKQSLLQQSNCTGAVWGEWLAEYLKQPGIPGNAKNVCLEAAYEQWFYSLFNSFLGKLKKGVDDMIGYWIAESGGFPQLAKANFNNLLNSGLEYNVTDANLQELQAFLNQFSVNMF